MTLTEFAAHLTVRVSWQVSPDAVERWEGGATPPGDVVDVCFAGAAPGPDVRAYSGRGLISRDQWNTIIRGTSDQLWLYGMAEFGYATDDDVPGILAEAASAGCDVRILLLHPDSPAAADVDADEGNPAGTLPVRIRASLAKFLPMRQPGIEIRTYRTHPTVSIVRGDNAMLVTPYLRYTLGSNSPTFEFTADSAPGMFGRYERHFNSMWVNSGEQV